MKADKFVKDILKRLNDLGISDPNSLKNNMPEDEDYGTDEYYIRIGDRPPRFRLYRHARWEKLDEWGQLTCQGVDDFITLDELNFTLEEPSAR